MIEFTSEAILAQINVLKFHLKKLNRNKHKTREKIKTKANRKNCLRTKTNGIINRQSKMYKMDKLLGRLTKEREYIITNIQNRREDISIDLKTLQ